MKRQSSLDRLLEGLLRAPHDYRPTTEIFPDLDIKKLAKKLELEARGKERLFRKEPIRPNGQFDDIETQIIEYIESEKKHAHQILGRVLIKPRHRSDRSHFRFRMHR